MPMSWVVYQSVQGKQLGAKSVCDAREWAALEAANPGANEVLHSGLQSESQAEKLARGTSGDAKKRAVGTAKRISLFQNSTADVFAEEEDAAA